MLTDKEIKLYTVCSILVISFYILGYLNGNDSGYKQGKKAGILIYQESRQDSIIKKIKH